MRLFLFCTAFLLLAFPAHGAVVDCQHFTIDLPDDWTTVQAPEEDKDGVVVAVFGEKAETASLSFVEADSDGESTKNIAQMLAPTVGATESPKEYKGQYGFAIRYNDVDGFCILSSGRGRFLLSCMHGEVSLAAKVLLTLQSDKYPELVPQ